MAIVVKKLVGIKVAAIDTSLEMQMRSGSTACLTYEGNDLTSLDTSSHFDHILRVVGIIGLKAVAMLDTD